MILQSPTSQRPIAPVRRTANEDGSADAPRIPPGGVEVIVLVAAVYNGHDHRPVNDGKECAVGSRIIVSTANIDFLVDRGLVRYLTPGEEESPAASAQVDLKVAIRQLADFKQMVDEVSAQMVADKEEWLDHTPLLAAEIPDSTAQAIFEAGLISKAKLQESYAQHGLNELLSINGIGNTRAIKIMRWAGVTIE